jgi:glycosyltransferase involved in cell wall biosynthesis
MRVALIADAFPPLRTSGAVQIRDLSLEFHNQDHDITVILPSADIKKSWLLEDFSGVRVLRLRAPRIKDVNHIRRAFAELLMPVFMWINLRKSPLGKDRWDGIVWYSPSIFHGPFVETIKRTSRCKSYLIIRDIFPQWAADMGLMNKRGLIYSFFNAVASYQYSVADVIGVQSPGNLQYFKKWGNHKNRRLEVLQNWIQDSEINECSIELSCTKLAGRKIFVYAGNMGVAQGVSVFIDLAESLITHLDIGFLFVGRGDDAMKIKDNIRVRGLDNTLFYDEIHPDEISGLFAQCSAGLVALDPKHKSHNVPGKFLTYMQAGLPVLARINAGNDLVKVIQENNVGRVVAEGGQDSLEFLALELLRQIKDDSEIKNRCRALFLKLFSTEAAVKKIVSALEYKTEINR